MKRILLLTLTLALTWVACNKVPLTGRKQLNLLPESDMLALSSESYNAFLDTSNVIRGTEQAAMVKEVGQKIAAATERFLRENGYKSRLAEFDWQFNLVKGDMANAWCMPGGRVVVYTGILPITKNPTGLAVVMGHEVAHAVARHGNERMSQGLAAQLGGVALSVAIKDEPAKTQNLFMAAYGVGAQLGVMLPFSRTHELEADKLGLVFMAMAGYDPREAVDFWSRMAAQSSGAAPPEFLSTHPSHQTRIEDIKAFLPEAMGYYNASKGTQGGGTKQLR